MEGLDLKGLVQNIGIIAEEKNLSDDAVIGVVEEAIAAAWRRDNGKNTWKVRAVININKGTAKVFRMFDVVAEPEDSDTQLTVEDAKKINKKAKEGETVEQGFDVKSFGRVAAQTAKQVLMQKLREAERAVVMAQYVDRVGEVLTGSVQRITPRVVIIEIGKTTGIMPRDEQIDGERYMAGQRIKALFKGIETDDRGSQMILSRSDGEFVRALFEQEVPELETGAVEIKGIAREAGRRTKMAVYSGIAGVDPVGTFVGGHGARVNAVADEINGERIDIVIWDKDIKNYIMNAIAPAEVSKIELDEKNEKAKIFVTEDQQSIAIGKSGQNVRLASVLTGYGLEIEAAAAAKPKKIASSRSAESSLVDTANAEGVEDAENSENVEKPEDLETPDGAGDAAVSEDAETPDNPDKEE
ncbi:MAG: transcription termination factor NusA [Candidatus Nomurabacteria bacterium]|jgi:N utilization substance protein A|nr:transcription termination factor NusA [Candidatus Nomurabacteria bacterium]